MTTPFVGTLSINERLHNDTASLKTALRSLAAKLRVALPGTITAFNPATQLAVVQLNVTENVKQADGSIVATPIFPIADVLVLLPGDANWCITFPSIVGTECLVCFADMCINAWWQNGGLQSQEVTRRHDLSDGFAILSPRSKPNAITNYSTSKMQLRSIDGTTSLSLSPGLIESNVQLKASSLATAQTAIPSTTASDHSIPITIGGIVYYMRLSTTP